MRILLLLRILENEAFS